MTEQIDTTEVENAELSENSELDIAATVEQLAAEDQAGTTEETADDTTEVPFEATEAQITMAKQLGVSDEDIANMSEAQAIAYDAAARLDSKRQQRKGKPTEKQEEAETIDSAESSTDDDLLTEDDLYTTDGIKKINNALKTIKELKSRDKQQVTSEQDRLQADRDKFFDDLDPDVFTKFLPGDDGIEPGSPAEEKRQEVVSMAKAIQGASTGDISMEKALEQALSVIAPAETEQAALNKDNDRREKRGKQRLSAPSPTPQKHVKVYDNPHDEAIDKIHAAISG